MDSSSIMWGGVGVDKQKVSPKITPPKRREKEPTLKFHLQKKIWCEFTTWVLGGSEINIVILCINFF